MHYPVIPQLSTPPLPPLIWLFLLCLPECKEAIALSLTGKQLSVSIKGAWNLFLGQVQSGLLPAHYQSHFLL